MKSSKETKQEVAKTTKQTVAKSTHGKYKSEKHKKLTKKRFNRTHIYIFGILSNLVPLLGLLATCIPKGGIDQMHIWQAVAWICGGVYYVFMWILAMKTYKRIKDNENNLHERIKILEDRLEG